MIRGPPHLAQTLAPRMLWRSHLPHCRGRSEGGGSRVGSKPRKSIAENLAASLRSNSFIAGSARPSRSAASLPKTKSEISSASESGDRLGVADPAMKELLRNEA